MACWVDLGPRRGWQQDKPGVGARGEWSTASAEVAEASAVLKGLLAKIGVSETEFAHQGTHACKATLLSWSAKAGMKSEFRRLHGGQFKQPIQQHAPSAVLVQTGLHLTLVRCLGVCSGNHKDKFHKIHISLLAEIYC